MWLPFHDANQICERDDRLYGRRSRLKLSGTKLFPTVSTRITCTKSSSASGSELAPHQREAVRESTPRRLHRSARADTIYELIADLRVRLLAQWQRVYTAAASHKKNIF